MKIPKVLIIVVCTLFSRQVFGQLSSCTQSWLQNQNKAAVRIGDVDVTGNTITVEAMINRTAPYTRGILYAGNVVSKHNDIYDVNYLLRPNTAEITTTNGYFRTPDICEIELNKTYHIALVYDGEKLKFYRNGFLMSQTYASGNLYNNDWITTIGELASVPGHNCEAFVGYINEVRIWNVVRTQSQLKQFMNTTLPNPASQTGLLAYYTFDDLKNKQGNAQWDGKILNNAIIKQSNPTCNSFKADSCAIKCNVNPQFSFEQDFCDPRKVHFVNETYNAFFTTWDFDNGTQSNLLNPKIIYSSDNSYNVKLIVQNEYGCIDSITRIVEVKSRASNLLLLDKVAICKGESVVLKVNDSYIKNCKWYPFSSLSASNIPSPVATPPNDTKYILTATDNDGCDLTDSVYVNVLDKPVISALTDTTICAGSTIHLQPKIIHANTYKWTPSKDLNNAIIADPFATPLTNTTYTITATNDGCSVQKNVTLNVLPSPVISLNNDTTICENVFIQLSAYGGTHYAWSPSNGLNEAGIANPLASPKTSTLYYVTVTDNNHCSSKDSVMINVSPSPSFSLDPINATICEGDALRLTASGGDVYQWQSSEPILNTDRATAYVKPSSNAVYNVTITNTVCKIEQQLSSNITVNKKPIINVSKSNDIDCVVGEAKLTATGGVQYTWSPASSLSNPFSQNPVAAPLSTTVYHVKVKGNNTCVSEDSVEVKVLFGSVTNGYLMPNAFTPNGDGLNDCFGVQQWGYITELDFSVYDRFGLMIFHTTNPSDCWNGTYKGILQSSGTFVYQIRAKTLCGSVYRKGTVVLIR